MTKKKVFFHEVRGDKYTKGLVEVEEVPISVWEKQKEKEKT